MPSLEERIAARLHEALDHHERAGIFVPHAQRGLAAGGPDAPVIVMTVQDVARIAAEVGRVQQVAAAPGEDPLAGLRDDVSSVDVDAAKTPAGAWTKRQLAEWGVPWPPPAGWKARLAANYGQRLPREGVAPTLPPEPSADPLAGLRHDVSPADVEKAKTPKGGLTRAQLAEWGVPWPPPRGWRARLASNYRRHGRDGGPAADH